MNRRHAVIALAGAVPLALVSTRSKAQSVPPLDAATYVQQTLQVGTLAKLSSQLALTQSSNLGVRKFAKSEILEQTAVAQSLNNNFNPPPAPLTPDQQQILASLAQLSGPDFDAAYINAQIAGHEELLLFQQGLLEVDTNPADDLVHIALIGTAFIETHLVLLHALLVVGQL